MTKKFKHLIGVMLALALVSASSAEERTLQVKVDSEVKVGTKRGDLLEEESILPPGSVIEVSLKDYQNPESLPYWDKTKGSQSQFVKNIRVVKAPGFSEQDVKEINRWIPVEGLYISKAQLGEGLVIQDSDRPQTVTLKKSASIMRNDGLGARGYPQPWEKNQNLSEPETNALVEQVQEINRSVGKTGQQVPYCRECANARFYQKFISQGVPALALQRALKKLGENPGGKIKRQDFMAIADYSKDSNQKRLFILNMKDGSVKTYFMAHGRGSETRPGHAGRFSNRDGSHQTPPGFHVTSKLGHSPKEGKMVVLDGIEPGINDRSNARRIYIHTKWYASKEHIRQVGYPGRSWGCITVPPDDLNEILKNLAGGALVYNFTGK